ncbi:acyltransferase [Umezawaea sp. Da 62-37]|uniref:acyltransferase family protein n=1 Tax=Umezawaea sp. Da 62-37 TaxID=3075927 RepID=UPI0028F72E2F|nr:acyltransferase [Umezawaea sp. Da 62-37]WNV84465.1 acyltransferase [Umezawaea sp. Da 62-37]
MTSTPRPTTDLTTGPNANTIASRLPSLTGMRFIAAFFVFTCHVSALGYFSPEVTAWLTRYTLGSGWLGVEFFFMLSGFVLMWSRRADDTKPRFWRRRFAKIYPVHVFTWLAAIVIALWAGEAITGARIVPSLFLVQAWTSDPVVMGSINVPSWTLSCELLFYLLFPWLAALVARIRPDRLWWWAGGVAAAAMLLPLLVYLVVSSDPLLPGMQMSAMQNWLLVSFPPARALDFALGVVLGQLVRTGGRVPFRMPAAIGLLAVGFALELLLAPTVFGLTMPLVVPLGLVLLAGAKADIEGTSSVFRAKGMIWLGELSFAFYMVHFLVLYYTHVAIGMSVSWSIPVAIGIALVLCGVTLLIAWGIHSFIERPAMRHWSRPRRTPDPRVATATDSA